MSTVSAVEKTDLNSCKIQKHEKCTPKELMNFSLENVQHLLYFTKILYLLVYFSKTRNFSLDNFDLDIHTNKY